MWTRRGVLRAGAALGATVLLPGRASWAATDQLVVALLAEPPHLDPTAPGADEQTLAVSYQNIFEGLTSIDESGAVRAGLAKSWSVSDDGRRYSFALADEVRYHDGTSFDASHVVFSLNRLLAPENHNPQRPAFAAIAAVTARDDATVEIALKQPDPQLPFNLGRPEAAIVAPESAGNNRDVPLATGPFAFVQWDRGARIVLQRNEDYWGVHPRLNEATFVFAPDGPAAVAAVMAGAIDGAAGLSPEAVAAAAGNAAVIVTKGKGPGGQLRAGAWNGRLSGMWTNTPLGGCPLAGIRWTDDEGAPGSAAAPRPPTVRGEGD